MAEGFFGRWSKRKLQAGEGAALPAEPQQPEPGEPLPSPQSEPVASPGPTGAQASGPAPSAHPPPADTAAAQGGATPAALATEPPPPTLREAQALTAESDFRPFARAGVPPEVKNAAMKKLFSDPHFSVMDRMDVYIDDYSQPDPIPPAMLRQLASAKFLGLFREEEEAEAERRSAEAASGQGAGAQQGAVEADGPPQPREVADDPGPQSVAQSPEASPAVPEPAPHDHPDLRLQPDDAAPGESPGRGT